jgi:hypothetical protein
MAQQLYAPVQAELTASDGGYNSRFGLDVAISGNTAAVLANPGVVYVYTKQGATWTQQTEVTLSDFASSNSLLNNGEFDPLLIGR